MPYGKNSDTYSNVPIVIMMKTSVLNEKQNKNRSHLYLNVNYLGQILGLPLLLHIAKYDTFKKK